MYDRYVENQGRHLNQFLPIIDENYRIQAVQKMTTQCFNQGISRFCKGDIQRIGIEDLQYISNFLGSNLYLMGGDKPTEIDFVLFGFLTVLLYTFPDNSVFRILVEKKLGNLWQFTERMKGNLFPDWDEIIGKDSLTELKNGDNFEKPARPPPPISKSPAKNTPQQLSQKQPQPVKEPVKQPVNKTAQNANQQQTAVNPKPISKFPTKNIPQQLSQKQPQTVKQPVKEPVKQPVKQIINKTAQNANQQKTAVNPKPINMMQNETKSPQMHQKFVKK